MRSIKQIFSLLLVVLLLSGIASSQGVRINECFTGVPDWCEIINLGTTTVDISGWTLIMADDPSDTAIFNFPVGTTIAPEEIIVVSESSTGPSVPAGTQFFVVSTNINWAGAGSTTDPDGAAGLNDSTGAGVDLVKFGAPTNIPVQNPASPFSGTLGHGDSIARNSVTDTDLSSDWNSLTGTSGTPGALNAGQFFIGPPVAAFSASMTAVVEGQIVNFTDLSGRVPTQWAWDFDGDGVTDSTLQNPSYAYAASGTYDVTLTVQNAQGTDTLTKYAYITVSAIPGLPYFEDFTSGTLGAEWVLQSEFAFGRFQFLVPSPASPLSGGNALAMDVSSSGTYCTNQASLTVDLSASGGGVLYYYAMESGDEPHAEDGLFVSDGVTTVKVIDHDILTSSWQEIFVDLNVVVATHGLNLGNPISLIFSQRDNYSFGNDGVYIDDIRVLPPPIPDTGQANSVAASMDINGGLNLNGRPATNGMKGPFFADGNMLDIVISGEPNQPYILALGPLNRNNVMDPMFGSLDIGMLGQTGSIADLELILNGATGTSFYDMFAFTDATGVSTWQISLDGLPLGVIGAFQAAVLASNGTAKLTATFEFTVTP